MSNVDDRLRKFSEFLNSPEGKARMLSIAKKMKEEEQGKIDFINSQRFQEILDLFETSALEHVSSDDYFDSKKDVEFLFNDENESKLFFNSVMDAGIKVVDEDAVFHTTLSYINKKFVAKLVCGQGSYVVLSRLQSRVAEIKNVQLGVYDQEPYGYIQVAFEDGSAVFQCFGNPNKVVAHLVLNA